MSEYIEIKSKAVSVKDYRDIDISEFIPKYEIDAAQLENDIERVLRAHGRRVSADVVSAGDQTEISCVSENSKFNKDKVFVMVGKGLYSRELEEKLIGMNKGEEKDIKVSEDTVKVCVKNITHTVLPELKDDSVASFGIEGVSSVEDLKRYCVDKQITRFLDEDESGDVASAQLAQAIMSESEFYLDAEELAAAEEMGENRIAIALEEKGELADDEILEDFNMKVGEYKALMKNIFVSELKAAAISYSILKEKNELLKLSDYETLIERHSSAAGVSVEEGKAQYPLCNYARETYAEFYLKSIDEYVDKKIKRAIYP